MPQLGETVVEGTITRWLKNEGEDVARDEPLFEISTDKVDTEVPSPLAGTLVQIKVQEGETVSVGTELAMIDTGGDGQAAAEEAPAKAEEAPAAEESGEPGQASAEAAPERTDGKAGSAVVAAPADGGPRSSILSPLVRRLAEENRIDLSEVTGSGTGGRITKKDVMEFLATRGERPAP